MAETTLVTQLKLEDNAASDDLIAAYNAIIAKRKVYDKLFSYYDGAQPIIFSTEKLQEAFGKANIYFAQNWIAVIVDALLDRLVLKGFDAGPEAINKQLADMWSRLHIHLDSDDVHEAVAVTGEAYLIVGEDAEGELEAYFNDPRMCHMVYDPEHPKQKLYAAKLWTDENGKGRIDLYYPDRIEHFISADKAVEVTSGQAFHLESIEKEDNIPVFHFRLARRRGKYALDPTVLSIQDAINKIFSDMLISSEFTSARQRVIISQADPGDLKTFDTWWIPAGDGQGQASSVQEIGGADLTAFLNAIKDLAASIGIISRTPRHFFFTQGGDPSGDALVAMEAPLVKKAAKVQASLEITWTEIASYLLSKIGVSIDASMISAIWDHVETVQPKAQAEIIKEEVAAGMPLVTSLRKAGWDKSEIDQMQKDKKEEKKQSTSLAQEQLAQLRAEQATGSNDGSQPLTSMNEEGNA